MAVIFLQCQLRRFDVLDLKCPRFFPYVLNKYNATIKIVTCSTVLKWSHVSLAVL